MIIWPALFFLPFVTSSCPYIYAERLVDYDDELISETPKWTLNGLAKSECIYQCSIEMFCMSVHYTPSGQTCVAFRQGFKGATPSSTPQPGLMLFQLRKATSVPGSACEVDADCASLQNSQCLEGNCTCDQGYDAEGNRCRKLTECTSFSNNFIRYPSGVFHGNDIQSSGGKTAVACQDFCRDNPACTSCDHHFASNTCYLQNIIATPADITEDTEYDFYQRVCNW